MNGAVKLPYAQAVENEFNLNVELLIGDQARALQYAFFAERAAIKVIYFPFPLERTV